MTYCTPTIISLAAAAAILFAGCSPSTPETQRRPRQPFGTVDGKEVFLYTLRNKGGMEARITNYGAIVVSLMVPDKTNKPGDIVLGFDSLSPYLKATTYFGAVVGRYGNRIGKARFTLDGKEYTLSANDGPNTLHGGRKGFDKVVWDADESTPATQSSLTLTYVSKDGEEGFPGTLTSTVTYTVTDSNELKLDYRATTDKPTVLNLTHHSYFNLAGAGNGDILSHEIMVNADRFTPVDAGLITTGELRQVEGTPMDFRKPTPIGLRIGDAYDQLKLGRGYDHNWVLNRTGDGLSLAARVSEKTSGRVMEVWTTEPGVQFYTGNFLDGSLIGKGGKPYAFRTGLCLETQHYPDSPNKPEFPSTVLRPGEKYTTSTVYRFSTM